MKYSLLSFMLLLSSPAYGHSAGTKYMTPDGRLAYELECDSYAACMNDARDICNGGNFDVLSTTGDNGDEVRCRVIFGSLRCKSHSDGQLHMRITCKTPAHSPWHRRKTEPEKEGAVPH